ncbi:FHA domain-containing protein [uncultured Desulfosarcina sp.]|uniref:FHA domain-containing protein n=1 Tax=uncultured Desulfosarcina sp. TaxID=218289 RepID=UPI0029C791D8|nr:FHA domain-containing protein [uncultured Desulfosarcina sp.]
MRGLNRHDVRLWSRLCIFLATAGLLVTLALQPCRSMAATGGGLVDAVLVIDNSGSMRKNDPEFLTPETVSAFLNRLPDTTRVGMVLFDQRARLLQSLTQLSDPEARHQLSSSLKKIDYRGKFTDSAAGIERAAYELKNDGRKEARKSIIFLTDGIVDTGDRQKDAELTQWLKTDLTAECNAAGIRILGIAFTENADFPLIQALASRTGGAYYRATRPEDIADVLDRIQALLPPEPPPALPAEPAPPKATAAPSEAPPEKPPAESSTLPDKEANGSRSFWKFYLPLILIIFVLMGLVAMLVFKLFSLPSWLGGRKDSPAPLPGMRDLPPPEWELQNLTNVGGIHRFDKPRVTVGRDEENDLTLSTPTVSNLHATIEYREGGFFLEDQRSTNGTRLNDHQLAANRPVRLKSGDRIGFANLVFKFVRLDQIVSGDTVMLEITPFDAAADESPEPRLGEIDLEKMLQRCLKRHLEQIRKLGQKYDEFVYAFFSEKMSAAIAVQARENMDRTLWDKSQHCSPLIKGHAFYVVCTLPVSASDAVEWFGSEHGGFTQFIFKWIKSDGYDVTACDQFCVITFGMEEQPWVSMTVVPTHDEPDPVEIMSVDFLSDAEKAQLGLEFDDHGRVL